MDSLVNMLMLNYALVIEDWAWGSGHSLKSGEGWPQIVYVLPKHFLQTADNTVRLA